MIGQLDDIQHYAKSKYIKPNYDITKQKCFVTKALLSFLIIYEQWYMELTGNAIPHLLQALALAIIGSTFIEIGYQVFELIQNRTFIAWFVFGVVSFFYSSIFGVSDSTSISSLITYFSFLVMCACAGMVSSVEKNTSWINIPIVIVSMLSAYFALTQGYERLNTNSVVLSMSSFNNPNNLGLMMDLGIFAVLFPQKKTNLISWILRGIMVSVFFYVVLRTGSRSALIASILVIAFAVYIQFRYMDGSVVNKRVKRIALVLLAICVCLLVSRYMLQSSAEGNSIYRLLHGFNRNEYSGRGDLYQKGWGYFLEHPIFGLGYDCFKVMEHGVFTHSTYMELLSCTGIVGFATFLYPVLTGLYENIVFVTNDNGRKLTLLLMLVISGTFGILYYNLVFMMLMYLTICDPEQLDRKGSTEIEDIRNRLRRNSFVK